MLPLEAVVVHPALTCRLLPLHRLRSRLFCLRTTSPSHFPSSSRASSQTLKDAGIDGEVIIVDDNSPDGTAEVAQRLAEQYPVRVHKRVTERGLATAVLAGFGLSTAKVCVVMDADGSHPVDALPNMVRMILDDKADIVVGSRHVPGGGSKDWPLFSQFKSKLAATLRSASRA